MSEDRELYSGHDVRITGSTLFAGEKQYAIGDITAVTVEQPKESKKLVRSVAGLYLLLLSFVLFEDGLPSWVLRVWIIAHMTVFLLYLAALVVGWSFLIPMLRRSWEVDRRSQRVITITVGRRRVPVVTSDDEQHVDSVERALRYALRHSHDDRPSS